MNFKYLARVLVVFVSVHVLAACTDEDGAQRTLESNGFSNIKMTGFRFWACGGKGADTCTGFSATSATGQVVTGAVSGSWFGCKGYTVRFD